MNTNEEQRDDDRFTLFVRNPVNSKMGWARDDVTGSAVPVVLRSYKDKRKAKNRARKNAQRKNRK